MRILFALNATFFTLLFTAPHLELSVRATLLVVTLPIVHGALWWLAYAVYWPTAAWSPGNIFLDRFLMLWSGGVASLAVNLLAR